MNEATIRRDSQGSNRITNRDYSLLQLRLLTRECLALGRVDGGRADRRNQSLDTHISIVDHVIVAIKLFLFLGKGFIIFLLNEV